jgi:hypothetical protein
VHRINEFLSQRVRVYLHFDSERYTALLLSSLGSFTSTLNHFNILSKLKLIITLTIITTTTTATAAAAATTTTTAATAAAAATTTTT